MWGLIEEEKAAFCFFGMELESLSTLAVIWEGVIELQLVHIAISCIEAGGNDELAARVQLPNLLEDLFRVKKYINAMKLEMLPTIVCISGIILRFNSWSCSYFFWRRRNEIIFLRAFRALRWLFVIFLSFWILLVNLWILSIGCWRLQIFWYEASYTESSSSIPSPV